jgi:hypothetical protein
VNLVEFRATHISEVLVTSIVLICHAEHPKTPKERTLESHSKVVKFMPTIDELSNLVEFAFFPISESN